MRLALALSLAATLSAHRLDEYLQATLISIAPDQVGIEITLTPGIAVAPIVLAMIDTDGDGVISAAEQQTYLRTALQAMTLESDGEKLPMSIVEFSFPEIHLFRQGLGSIQIHTTAPLPYAWRSNRKLAFTNRHASSIAAYLVNCLAPTSTRLSIQQQSRDYLQSTVEVTYSAPPHIPSLWWLSTAALAILALCVPRIRTAIHFN